MNLKLQTYGNNVYVVWGGNPDEKVVGNMFFVKSSDNGDSFPQPISLTNEKNSLNVEIIADKSNIVYVAWQALLPDGNEEILFKKSQIMELLLQI